MVGSTRRIASIAVALAAAADIAIADPNDWVNIDYVFYEQGPHGDASTVGARHSITMGAGETAQKGPWTITKNNGVSPPNKNSHDYLSWAPYHWPNCNWCGQKSTREVDSEDSFPFVREGQVVGIPVNASKYETGSHESSEPSRTATTRTPRAHMKLSLFSADSSVSTSAMASSSTTSPGPRAPLGRFNALKRTLLPSASTSAGQLSYPNASVSQTEGADNDSKLPLTPAPSPTGDLMLHMTNTTFDMVRREAQKKVAPKCTPSPTTSMAPSATWTTCPYVVRDGQVNPDVGTLTNSASMNDMSQSVLYNAIAYILENKASVYSQKAAAFLDTFFLEVSTALNPNVNFGQLVRGPGQKGQVGTFTGVLDLRGMVKVVNAVALLLGSHSPDWTSQRHSEMKNWMKQYSNWLQTSELGKEVAGKPNNHATFYFGQLAVTQIFLGDLNGAKATIRHYFSTTFLDQIAATGEQPFEAVRTRPYHYRCFNLEAMITLAKLGDQLGTNYWTTRSKYGSTIQSAVDFAMQQDPKKEKATELVPHVAAVAAAYGDPQGKYAAFMQRVQANYRDQPFWFYDQTAALPNSPAAGIKAQSVPYSKHSVLPDIFGAVGEPTVPSAPDQPSSASVPPSPSSSSAAQGNSPDTTASDTDPNGIGSVDPQSTSATFSCPGVFADEDEVEIDDGIFVNCAELRPFYEAVSQTISEM